MFWGELIFISGLFPVFSMLDGRILAAVLASIAAIAVGINGGGIAQGLDADQVKSSSISAPGEFSFNELMPESLSSVTQFFQNPEPENSLRASLVADDISGETLKVRRASLTADNFTSLDFGSRHAASDGGITVYGFTGTVEPASTTDISGRANGFTSNGVNISGRLNFEKEIETRRIELEGVERTRLKLEDTSGSIKANSSTTRIRQERQVNINSFSGDITVFPENNSVILDGKVDRLESGSFSFGG